MYERKALLQYCRNSLTPQAGGGPRYRWIDVHLLGSEPNPSWFFHLSHDFSPGSAAVAWRLHGKGRRSHRPAPLLMRLAGSAAAKPLRSAG
jgi:hypothetical protein